MWYASSFFTQTTADWVGIILTVFSVILVPILLLMLRGAIRWTKVEDKLGMLVEDIRELISDKDRVHAELIAQMRSDREATDRRLRDLESFWMEIGRKSVQIAKGDGAGS